jgi:hypothetical protein
MGDSSRSSLMKIAGGSFTPVADAARIPVTRFFSARNDFI